MVFLRLEKLFFAKIYIRIRNLVINYYKQNLQKLKSKQNRT